MIDFTLSEEHEALRRTVREFARDVVAPVIAEHYENHTFPYEIVRQMGKMGLFGLPFPEEYGGVGGGYPALCLPTAEHARAGSAAAAPAADGLSLGPHPSFRAGMRAQDEQRRPRPCAGETLPAIRL